jgi:zinc/manganese transport system ATP-binding protein
LGAAVSAPAAPTIKLENLTLGYEGRIVVEALEGVIAPGDLLALCGPNGGGKSTILKAIAGLLAPLSGSVRIERGSAGEIAYLPQGADIDLSFPIRVGEFVSLGALRRRGLFAGSNAEERARVVSALEAVGLSGLERRPLGALSGGQLQRALFARLIVEDRDVILLDEPFGAIDRSTTEDLLALVARWHEQGRTVIAALHEFDLVRRAFPNTLLVAGRPIFFGDTRQALSEETLAAAEAAARRREIACGVQGAHNAL